jgi:anti-sigma factor RsiW
MADQPLSDQERENLIAYLDGELTESEAQALEGKLNRDPKVRAEVDALRRTWDLLDYLPKPEPSVSFTNRTMDRVTTMLPPAHGWGRGRRWLLGLSWAAALLLATLAG